MNAKASLIPMVVEKSGNGERAYDIYSRLLKDRIVFVGGEIGDDMANAVVAQLLFLQAQDPEKEVSMYINSPGGSVTAGLAILDTMKMVKCPVATYCVGRRAGQGERHRDHRAGDPAPQGDAQRNPRRGVGPHARERRERHRPRPLHVRRRGEVVGHRRQGAVDRAWPQRR